MKLALETGRSLSRNIISVFPTSHSQGGFPMLSTYYAIVISVLAAGLFVYAAALVVSARLARKPTLNAKEALARATAYAAMRDSWEAHAKQAQLMDAGIRAQRAQLAKVNPAQGTVIGHHVRRF
jgi:hypothetical protein